MNSYFKTNRNYMEAYKADKNSRISRYPENINYKDFFMFLRHPTLVYQDIYPLVKEFSLVTVFKRFIVIVFGIVSLCHFIQYLGSCVRNLSISAASFDTSILRWSTNHRSFLVILHSHHDDVLNPLLCGLRFCLQLLC